MAAILYVFHKNDVKVQSTHNTQAYFMSISKLKNRGQRGFVVVDFADFFQIKLCLGMKRYYLFYTIRSGIRLPLLFYIAVEDRFPRTEKNIHSSNSKFRDVGKNIFRVPPYKSSI